jgi:hypothetical protein
MKAPRIIPFHKSGVALWIWRPRTPARRYAQELLLLERRVAAARFGINSPQRFFGSSVHDRMM